jgi:hypothetical protein
VFPPRYATCRETPEGRDVTQTPEADVPAQGASPPPRPGASGSSSDALLQELLARLCQVMSADVSQFLLVEGDVLRVMASHGVPLPQVRDGWGSVADDSRKTVWFELQG